MEPIDSPLDLLLVDRRGKVFGVAVVAVLLALARDDTESPRDLERADLRGVVAGREAGFFALAGGLGGRLLDLLVAPRPLVSLAGTLEDSSSPFS